jgi:hypothetical protein
MKKLTSAQLFAAPKSAGKAKARLERAKLVIVAARERAVETVQQCATRTSTMRHPYRAAEAPLGREVQREALIPRFRIARPGAAPRIWDR